MSQYIGRLLSRFRKSTPPKTPIMPSMYSSEAGYDFYRPVGGYVPMSALGLTRLPVLTLPFGLAYDLVYNSDVLRTTIRALVNETFRNGIRIRKAWTRKCARCGTEFNEEVDVCPVCNSTEFIIPNEKNRRWLEKFIHDVNLNNDSLIDVLMQIDFDLNVVDNAFLVVTKKYYFNDEGEIEGAEPLEVLRADPRWMRLVISKDGRPAMDDSGKRVAMFCPEHRDKLHYVDKDKVHEARCPICGKKMLPAYYAYVRSGKTIYYTNGEVLHIKKFTYGAGYGYPPIMTIWLKVMILMRMDYFVLLAYYLQRSPRGLLIVKGLSREKVEQAWQYLMEKARINPHIVYPLIVEANEKLKGNIAEWVDLSVKPREIDFIQYRTELRRSIMALYGVMPLYLGEPGGSGRDVMQVTVTNRTIEMEQRLFNEKILPWLMKQIGITDWKIEVAPVEMRDEMTMVKLNEEKLRYAEMLEKLGFEVTLKLNERGEIEVTFDPRKRRVPTANNTSVNRDEAEKKREQYYYEQFVNQKVEGEPVGARERPRKGEQRVEGEPNTYKEGVEGERKV